jgi:hypothetical protein
MIIHLSVVSPSRRDRRPGEGGIDYEFAACVYGEVGIQALVAFYAWVFGATC